MWSLLINSEGMKGRSSSMYLSLDEMPKKWNKGRRRRTECALWGWESQNQTKGPSGRNRSDDSRRVPHPSIPAMGDGYEQRQGLPLSKTLGDPDGPPTICPLILTAQCESEACLLWRVLDYNCSNWKWMIDYMVLTAPTEMSGCCVDGRRSVYWGVGGNERKDLSVFTANLLMQYIRSRAEFININFAWYKERWQWQSQTNTAQKQKI